MVVTTALRQLIYARDVYLNCCDFAVGIALAALVVLLIRLVLVLRFRHPLWSVPFHPAAEAILLALGLSSSWRCKSGRGVAWNGREYHKAAKI